MAFLRVNCSPCCTLCLLRVWVRWASVQRVPSCCSLPRAAVPADVSLPPRAAESADCCRRWDVPALLCWGGRCGARVACALRFPRALGLCLWCARPGRELGCSFGLGGLFVVVGPGSAGAPFVLGGSVGPGCFLAELVRSGCGLRVWGSAAASGGQRAPSSRSPPPRCCRASWGAGWVGLGFFFLCPSGGGGSFFALRVPPVRSHRES